MFEGTKALRRVPALVRMAGLVTALGAVAGLAACDDDNTNIVLPIVNASVAVFRDPSFDFTTLRTFSMPDTVVQFDLTTGTAVAVSRAFDQEALDAVRRNLLARGYVEVTDPATTRPDFVMLVGATAATRDAFVSYSWFGQWGFYSGWGWFAPGFDVDWGIDYPWAPVTNLTTFERATLIVDLIPTANVNPATERVRSAWAGVATRILDGTLTGGAVNLAVDRMFQLSPYLVAGPLP